MVRAIICLIGVAVISPAIWQADYSRDSFWTLSIPGQIGVIMISTVCIGLLFWIIYLKTKVIRRLKFLTRTARTLFDIAAGLLIFGVAYTMSPQIYYSFYQIIFDNLPNQIVIKSVLNTERLQDIAMMRPSGSLSDHLAGITFWAIIPFTLWRS